MNAIALERTIELAPPPAMPMSVTAPGANLPTDDDLARIYKAVEYISLSRDGTAVVTRRQYDSALLVISTVTSEVISTFKSPAQGWFQLTPSGKEIAVLADNGRSVVFYDFERWQKVHQTADAPAQISRFSISPDGSNLAITYIGGLHIWSFAKCAFVADKKLESAKLWFLAWSRDSAMLSVACGGNGAVWSSQDWNTVYPWQGPMQKNYRYPVMALDFTTDDTLVVGDNLGFLNCIDVRSKVMRPMSDAEDAPVFAIKAAPVGGTVAVGRGNGFLELWDLTEGRRSACVRGHADSLGKTKYVECIDWFPDGRRLCTWGGYEAKVWTVS
jgi:WD40 repeat protein